MTISTYKIPYGKTFKEVSIPAGNILGLLASREYSKGISEVEVVENALKNPIGSISLCEMSRNIKKLLLITNDMTRPMPSRITIPALLREIKKFNPEVLVTIIIASGLHREMTPEELIEKLDEEIYKNYRVVVHNAYDKDKLVNFGEMKTGNELWLNREIIENDLIISEGFIEAHWLAGFSGGRKSILPGLAGAETVMNNHSAFNVDHHMARPGILGGNPVHEEFIEASQKAGLKFILNVVLDKDKKIINAFAGDTIKAHEAGCAFVKEIMEVPCEPADIVITSNSGYPLDINLYQSMKGLDTAAAAAKDGAVLIISTECPEGIGHGGFSEVYKLGKTEDDILEALRSLKIKVYDQWGAQVMLRLSQKYTIIIVTENIDKNTLREMYLEHAASIQEAFEMALEIKGKDAKVNIIPEGPVIIPVVENSNREA